MSQRSMDRRIVAQLCDSIDSLNLLKSSSSVINKVVEDIQVEDVGSIALSATISKKLHPIPHVVLIAATNK
jgi:hypothetical protein